MRLSRLLGILLVLLDHDRITCRELADRFEVSVRTIMRDIDDISMAGVPIVSVPGSGGGVGIMPGYRIHYLTFSADELQFLLVGLRGMSDTVKDDKAETIGAKLEWLLANYPEPQHSHIVLDLEPWDPQPQVAETVQMLHDAARFGKLVRFRYTNSKGHTAERTVEPVTLVLKGSIWYVYGYCCDRQDYRLFRMSRIQTLQLSTERFLPQAHSIQGKPWQQAWHSENNETVTLRLRFSDTMEPTLRDWFRPDQIARSSEGKWLVSAAFPWDRWVTGMLLSFGSQVEILDPDWVRLLMKEELKKMTQVYGQT